MTYVYGLYSTRDNAVRYVGETVNSPSTRLKTHLNNAISGRENSVKSDWICKEIESGYEIQAIVLAENARDHVDEQRFIDAFRLVLGEKLLNTTSGHWASNRIKEGLDKARENGSVVGRPPLDPAIRDAVRRELLDGRSINSTAREIGVGVATVHRIKKIMVEEGLLVRTEIIYKSTAD